MILMVWIKNNRELIDDEARKRGYSTTGATITDNDRKQWVKSSAWLTMIAKGAGVSFRL